MLPHPFLLLWYTGTKMSSVDDDQVRFRGKWPLLGVPDLASRGRGRGRYPLGRDFQPQGKDNHDPFVVQPVGNLHLVQIVLVETQSIDDVLVRRATRCHAAVESGPGVLYLAFIR